MGKSASDVFAPAASYIPGLESTLKVVAEHEPQATASLAAQIYLWLANP
jgi:hypothetical protein